MLPFVGIHLGISRSLSALLAVPFPHLFTELVHCIKVWVVDELHEVSVPDFLAWSHAVGSFFYLGAIPVFLFMKQLLEVFCIYDLQGRFEESLHEAMLYSMTKVSA